MGKKIESNLKNMVIVLFTITLIASTAVGYIYTVTAGPIEEAKAEKQANAIKEVIPVKFDKIEKARLATDADSVNVFFAKKDNKLVGTAVETFSKNGFSGKIAVMVGINPEGAVTGYSVLEANETPGLGSKMDKWFTKEGKGNVIGMKPGDKGLIVTKDGGEVNAITSATITSRAFCDAVNRAVAAIGKDHCDAKSGSTKIKTQQTN